MSEKTLLRVAVTREQRIIFDRNFPLGTPVTIGRDAECTVVLRGHVPETHALFEYRNGRYLLNIIGVMEVRVKRDGAVMDTAALELEHLLLTRTIERTTVRTFSLRLVDRGVVYLDGYRVLFEFVTPIARSRPSLLQRIFPRFKKQ